MGKIVFFLLWFSGVLFDQITKWWAEECLQGAVVPVISQVLELRLRKNFASAFGLQFLNRPQHVVVTVGVTVFLLLVLFSGRHPRSLPFFFGGSLYLAGAWGNLIDRLWRGYVVDFIEPSFWATFNVADIFIVAGVIGIVWGFLHREERKNPGL